MFKRPQFDIYLLIDSNNNKFVWKRLASNSVLKQKFEIKVRKHDQNVVKKVENKTIIHLTRVVMDCVRIKVLIYMPHFTNQVASLFTREIVFTDFKQLFNHRPTMSRCRFVVIIVAVCKP